MYTAKTKVDKKRLWTCPKCKRKFERRGQVHSCKPFPLAQHFADKEEGKHLYQLLRRAIKSAVGPYKVESLQCCIHFVSRSAFAAVKIFKNKIRVDFTLSRIIKEKRIRHSTPMSAHRYLYCVDVMTADDIDAQLIEWIKEARDIRSQNIENHDNK